MSSSRLEGVLVVGLLRVIRVVPDLPGHRVAPHGCILILLEECTCRRLIHIYEIFTLAFIGGECGVVVPAKASVSVLIG